MYINLFRALEMLLKRETGWQFLTIDLSPDLNTDIMVCSFRSVGSIPLFSKREEGDVVQEAVNRHKLEELEVQCHLDHKPYIIIKLQSTKYQLLLVKTEQKYVVIEHFPVRLNFIGTTLQDGRQRFNFNNISDAMKDLWISIVSEVVNKALFIV